jgi:DNA-binding HxlR family transcriptional regulator
MIDFKGQQFQCHMEVTLDLIGGKWKLLLLYKLGGNKVMRFNELGRLHPRLTQKMLAQQLRELEADGLVNRKSYNQVPPKVEYSLTELGAALMPIMEDMISWGKAYLSDAGAPKDAGLDAADRLTRGRSSKGRLSGP